jgi:hypothetical protein
MQARLSRGRKAAADLVTKLRRPDQVLRLFEAKLRYRESVLQFVSADIGKDD